MLTVLLVGVLITAMTVAVAQLTVGNLLGARPRPLGTTALALAEAGIADAIGHIVRRG
jgi:hypothetical protein